MSIPAAYNTINDLSDFAGVLARRLQKIYKSSFQEGIVNRILSLTGPKQASWPGWNMDDVILITYGNSLLSENEPPLRSLDSFMKEKLSGIINCVHLLPFFPYTSDDGFAVSDYMTVNVALGNWDDISLIGRDHYLMIDLVLNHVSSAHPWFKNFLRNEA